MITDRASTDDLLIMKNGGSARTFIWILPFPIVRLENIRALLSINSDSRRRNHVIVCSMVHLRYADVSRRAEEGSRGD